MINIRAIQCIVLILGILGASCSSGEFEDEPKSLQEKLEELVAPDSFFTLVCNYRIPDWTGINLLLHNTGFQDPCSHFTEAIAFDPCLDKDPDGPGSFNYIMVSMNNTKAGDYQVVSDEDFMGFYSSEDPVAGLRFIEFKEWHPRRYVPAVSGTVSITSGPDSVESWNAGIGLTGTLSVRFPTYKITTQQGSGGTGVEWEHTCKDEVGNIIECVGGFDCCYFAAEETFEVEIEFSADQCNGINAESDYCQTQNEYRCSDLQ